MTCYPMICVHKFSYFIWAYQTYEVSNYCIFVSFIVLVICLHFMYKFSPLMESVYLFHSSPLHICLFGSVHINLSTQLLVSILSSLVCTLCNQPMPIITHWQYFLLYNGQVFDIDQT